MTNYKKILKHRLYERYMDNPAEFMELCKLMDDIDDVIRQNDTISREAACDAIAAADITDGTVPIFSGRKVQKILMGLPRFQPRQKLQKGDTVITKISKSGISKGTKGVIVRVETMYKFISDFSNDYQAWYTAEELEEAKDETL